MGYSWSPSPRWKLRAAHTSLKHHRLPPKEKKQPTTTEGGKVHTLPAFSFSLDTKTKLIEWHRRGTARRARSSLAPASPNPQITSRRRVSFPSPSPQPTVGVTARGPFCVRAQHCCAPTCHAVILLS